MGSQGTEGAGITGSTAGRKEALVTQWGRHRRLIRPRPKQTRDKINREIGSREGRTPLGGQCLEVDCGRGDLAQGASSSGD